MANNEAVKNKNQVLSSNSVIVPYVVKYAHYLPTNFHKYMQNTVFYFIVRHV